MLLSVCLTQLKAQVTIGEKSVPDPSAVLDLRSKGNLGLLLPRVVLTDTVATTPVMPVKGMFVYNTTPSGDGKVVEGVYYGDGRRWWQTSAGASVKMPEQWFYMPSFNLPLSEAAHPDGKGLTFDLYQEYVDQFSGTVSHTTPPDPSVTFVAADGDGVSAAPTSVVTPYSKDKLIFYVTAYSHDVIKVNSIDNGILNYDVVTAVVPDGSFINVIFKVKQ